MTTTGLRTPLQFTPHGTLATEEGPDYVKTQVNQVVNVRGGDESGRQRGEYKWLTEFGNIVDLARHHPREVFEDLMEAFVDDALSRWVPDASFIAAGVVSGGRLRQIARVAWRYRGDTEDRFAEAEL